MFLERFLEMGDLDEGLRDEGDLEGEREGFGKEVDLDIGPRKRLITLIWACGVVSCIGWYSQDFLFNN